VHALRTDRDIAGQGTVGLEFEEQYLNLDYAAGAVVAGPDWRIAAWYAGRFNSSASSLKRRQR